MAPAGRRDDHSDAEPGRGSSRRRGRCSRARASTPRASTSCGRQRGSRSEPSTSSSRPRTSWYSPTWMRASAPAPPKRCSRREDLVPRARLLELFTTLADAPRADRSGPVRRRRGRVPRSRASGASCRRRAQPSGSSRASRDLARAAGARDPEQVGRRLALLYTGAAGRRDARRRGDRGVGCLRRRRRDPAGRDRLRLARASPVWSHVEPIGLPNSKRACRAINFGTDRCNLGRDPA